MENLILEMLVKNMPPLLSMSGMFLIAKFLFLHMTLAYLIYRDAMAQEYCALDIPPVIWSFMALASPIWGLLVYWLMHHSVLMRLPKPNEAEKLAELKFSRMMTRFGNGNEAVRETSRAAPSGADE